MDILVTQTLCPRCVWRHGAQPFQSSSEFKTTPCRSPSDTGTDVVVGPVSPPPAANATSLCFSFLWMKWKDGEQVMTVVAPMSRGCYDDQMLDMAVNTAHLSCCCRDCVSASPWLVPDCWMLGNPSAHAKQTFSGPVCLSCEGWIQLLWKGVPVSLFILIRQCQGLLIPDCSKTPGRIEENHRLQISLW